MATAQLLRRNGSASLVNWREYIDDKRKYPYRGIRGGGRDGWRRIFQNEQLEGKGKAAGCELSEM